MDDDRFGRQCRLKEVGADGQARIVTTAFGVTESEGADVERAYLTGAGGQVIDVAGEAVPFAHADAFRFAATRAVAAGAWRALQQIRRALRASDRGVAPQS